MTETQTIISFFWEGVEVGQDGLAFPNSVMLVEEGADPFAPVCEV